ncbi:MULTISPECIES: hypothetical protein [Clostridium]|uniref:Uncharacterized protein n=3 Tax=Clostridium perfringens TaxID=1502 RepID=A0AAN5UPS8_CLOPF|nr:MULTISPECIES: hypothetical protein [Clostridium]ABG83992.1 hypothetical protein CPF_0660 [Clostridium perfringens ATCC 13124]AQW23060.1 hypothetical protein BXT91_03790 [Clostridium perfringens]ATD49391.1 hypothetical protein CMR01_11555 [Clostridium perfringens]EDT24154.1 hypothetical protein AC1_0814 [Clostridium perfringens B str. ATCC 3626]EGT3620556.1 hypothetical protein [Clostridium perfringens]
MLGGLLWGLLIAWILSIFNFNYMFINAVYELLRLKISTDVDYVVFALLGLIYGIINKDT